ncbi:MAG: AI-2E family transporter [Polyangiaceae bacterium]
MTSPTNLNTPSSGRMVGGWTRPRVVFLAISAFLFVAFVVWANEVLLPFILGLIIAYVLTPLVARCERARIPRPAAILIVYAVTLSIIYFSFAAIAPRIYDESAKFTRDAPALLDEASKSYGPRIEGWVQSFEHRRSKPPAVNPAPNEVSAALQVHQRPDGVLDIDVGSGLDVVQRGPGHWRVVPAQTKTAGRFSVSDLTNQGLDEGVSYVKRNAFELILLGHAVIQRVARSIFLLFMTLMVAGYIMHTREAIVGFFRSLPPPRSRIGFDRLVARLDRGLSGVVRGQLLICAVNGVLSAIGFALFGLKYWPILAIVAAVMSIVPIFGSITSAIPAVMIGLTQGLWTALSVLIWIVGIHQIEANLLNPKIIGTAAKIHPVLVVLALITGEHFFGIWGALLGVPVLSLTQGVFQHFRYEAMPDGPVDSVLPGQTK